MVTADDNYIRESIFRPGAKVVAGHMDIMPSFAGQVSEEEVIAIIAYLRSLQRGETPPRVEDFPAPTTTPPINSTESQTMTTETANAGRSRRFARRPRFDYLNVSRGVASWLLTKDHKRIAILYLLPITAMFFIGGLFHCRRAAASDDARRARCFRPTPITAASRRTASSWCFFSWCRWCRRCWAISACR